MSNNQQYVSCIKIAGKPIIPPLLTAEKRQECEEYKLKAIELEKKKERTRLLKKCMKDLAELQKQTENLTKFDETPPRITTLENQLAFTEENSPKHVPFCTFKKLQNLKSETIDVTEYGDGGMKLISRTSSSGDVTPQPKLIRSNSYIIDTPSPILLAHLEKQAKKSVEIEDFSTESHSSSPITIIDSETSPSQQQNSEKNYQITETDISIQELSISAPQELEIEPNKIPKDIMDILNKQEETYQTIKNKILTDQIQEEKPMSVSISSNQILHYTITSPNTVTEHKNSEDELRLINLRNSRNSRSNLTMKKERAASIIGAAVKGYLVRRLIRTEKVQSLIETIKDALLCAIELHGAEIIEEADVELHRRLIQQVSAACYAFHDIFFTLSTKEQMGIIALDRQRRIEKAKRPLSSGSSRLSTPRTSQRSNTKMVR